MVKFVLLLLAAFPSMVAHAAEEQTDLCVLGATPAGIAASIAAARLGSHVLLIERTDHIGGLPANGLGVTDIATRGTIGGIFREFVGRIREHYVQAYGADSQQVRDSDGGYRFEPSVAERILQEMLAEAPGVRVLRLYEFDGDAYLEGRRLVSIAVRHRKSGDILRIKAGIFVDATYEGDLAAAAKVPYRIGREGRNQTLEPYAGVFYSYFGTKSIREYPNSGQPDNRIQAYNYRFCITARPDLRVMPERPASYNRADFADLAGDLRSGRVVAWGRTPMETAGVFKWVPIPNGKTDVNHHHNGLTSTDLAEENQQWPEANWAWRERYERRLRDYTLGLMWFTQHDPELPEEFRKEALRWGLCKDEYTDNGNFPRQVYVREARRIRGEYDFSALDAIVKPGAPRTTIHPDSVTSAHYPIDSHATRKREPDKDVLEGFLALDHITRPYAVPYRVMVPREVDGLLVPVAVSATHLGFGTLRMEPCWMALGQAAGVAAHLARSAGVEARHISIGRLQRTLLEQGQILVYYRDLKGDEPYFRAIQFYGLRGWFPYWDAEPKSAVLRAEAIEWLAAAGIQVWDRERPYETLDWKYLERWLGRPLRKGAHEFVLRHELASTLYEMTAEEH